MKCSKFLRIIFFTQLFERFSYYGIRSMLILFLMSNFGLVDRRTYGIYALFSALSFSGPVFSGILADKIFGSKRMILLGCIVGTIGHTMIFLFCNNLSSFLTGIGIAIVGTGFFKSNINTLLNECYEKNDPENQNVVSGFTLLHVGVNIGAGLSPVLCGLLAHLFGWRHGFMVSGISMWLSTIVLLLNRKIFVNVGNPSNVELADKKILSISLWKISFLGALLVGVFIGYLLQHFQSHEIFFDSLGVLMLLVFMILLIASSERMNFIMIGVIVISQIVFFAFEMQLGCLMVLFAERNVVKEIFGRNMPSIFFQAFSPLFIVICGFLFTKFNCKRSIYNFCAAMFSNSLCFFILYLGCLDHINFRVHYLYFILAISVISTGELIMWPYSQYRISTLSPKNLRGFMMGFLLFALAFSNFFGVYIGKFMSVGVKQFNIAESLATYQSGFLKIAFYSGVIVTALVPFVIFFDKKTEQRQFSKNSNQK